MKIRDGFVSNSSSSSFVINCVGKTKTVYDVVKLMINLQIQRIKEEKWGDWQKNVRVKKQWLKKLKNVGVNHSVEFPSCNYDTWIKKIGNQILISTCNNEDWDIPNQAYLSEETIEELKTLIKEQKVDDIVEYYDFYIQNYFDDFYSLNFDIIGTEVDFDYNGGGWDSYACQNERDGRKCNIHLWKTKIGVKCPICDKKSFEVFKRKEKLEQLNNLYDPSKKTTTSLVS